MEKRKTLSVIVGAAQSIVGLASAALDILLFFSVLEVQTIFNSPPEFLPLYLLILSLFSLFSIISAVILIREIRR